MPDFRAFMLPEPPLRPANLVVLHGLFESVHYVIPRGLDQTASVAQLAEQLICNQQVAGSTPAASSACPASRQCRPDFSTHERTAIPSVTPFRLPPAQPLFQPEVTSTTRTNIASGHPPAAPTRGIQPAYNQSIRRCHCLMGRSARGVSRAVKGVRL